MTAPAVATKPALEEMKIGRPRIPGGQIVEEGQHRRRFWLKLPPGMTDEDVRYPETWVHFTRYVVRHDLVTLLAADESWELEVCVERVLTTGVEVSVRKKISRKGIEAVTLPVAEGYRCEWSPRNDWHVIREADGHVVTRNHGLASSAIAQWRAEQPRSSL
jgi:hypothetical protein